MYHWNQMANVYTITEVMYLHHNDIDITLHGHMTCRLLLMEMNTHTNLAIDGYDSTAER